MRIALALVFTFALSANAIATTGDYLNEMLVNGRAEKWSLDQMPLRVYIGGGASGYRSSYQILFTAAMDEWSAASGRRITWTRVGDPADANVIANWEGCPNAASGEAGDTATNCGTSADGQRRIMFARISLTPTNQGVPYTDAEMRKICLHEIGHALGLRHSATPGDIMYFQSNPAQISALRPRDTETIRRLYSGAN